MKSFAERKAQLTNLIGSAIVQGFHEEAVELNQVLAFDLRFNLRHPKIAAIYMLETPINGCHFEVVKRDGNRYHVGGDIAARILGEEKAFMANLEQIATQAKEQSGLIKQFCRKCDLFSKLYPEEHQEQQLKDRQKAMEEAYLDRAGGAMSRLASADKSLSNAQTNKVEIESDIPVISSAVSTRIRTKLRTNCEIQFAVAHAHLPQWVNFLHNKIGQVLGSAEVWAEVDPTNTLKFEARDGKILLSRNGSVVGEWDNYEEAYKFMSLGLNSMPNPVLPLTVISYTNATSRIPTDENTLKKIIRSQVTSNICDKELWHYLSN